MRFRTLLASVALFVAAPAVGAQQAPTVAELEARIAAQDDQISELRQRMEEQDKLIRRLLDRSAEASTAMPAPAPAPQEASAQPASAPPLRVEAQAARAAPEKPRLALSGDLRVRQEFNFSDGATRDRSRTAIRARLRARYSLSDKLMIGAGLSTGDPTDPNSTDVTLSGFNDDLPVSLDQAWLGYANGGLSLYAGKFPQIFARSEMVWDGDVNLQGVAGAYSAPVGGGAKLDARALYFILDESATGPDSSMLGAQAQASLPAGAEWNASVAAAYYHYRLDSLVGTDSGVFRTNLSSQGRFLSDFRLADMIGTLTYSGIGERWPVQLNADYVHNFGAAVEEDSGYNIELALGRTVAPGDLRFAYVHSRVGVDAVLAIFSRDNIPFGTNYMLHALTLDYVPVSRVLLNASFYHYRLLDAVYSGPFAAEDWRNRLRLSLMYSF